MDGLGSTVNGPNALDAKGQNLKPQPNQNVRPPRLGLVQSHFPELAMCMVHRGHGTRSGGVYCSAASDL